MRVLQVSYDLRKPERNYEGLIEELKNSPNWWHHLGSTWLILTNETATELWDRISRHVDKDDTVLVTWTGHWQRDGGLRGTHSPSASSPPFPLSPAFLA